MLFKHGCPSSPAWMKSQGSPGTQWARSLINEDSKLISGSDIAKPPFLACLSSLAPLGIASVSHGAEKGWGQKEFPWEITLALHTLEQQLPRLVASRLLAVARHPGLWCSPPELLPRHYTCLVMQCQVTFYLACFRGAEKKGTILHLPKPLKSYTLSTHSFHLQQWSTASTPGPCSLSLLVQTPCLQLIASFKRWDVCPLPPADPAHSAPSETLGEMRSSRAACQTNILTALTNIFHRFLVLH